MVTLRKKNTTHAAHNSAPRFLIPQTFMVFDVYYCEQSRSKNQIPNFPIPPLFITKSINESLQISVFLPLFFSSSVDIIKYYQVPGTTLSITSFNPHLSSVRELPLLSAMGTDEVVEASDVRDWWGWIQDSRTGRHVSYPTLPPCIKPRLISWSGRPQR